MDIKTDEKLIDQQISQQSIKYYLHEDTAGTVTMLITTLVAIHPVGTFQSVKVLD